MSKVDMIAQVSTYSSKYGMIEGGKNYSIDEADAGAFEARGYLKRGGAKMDEAPANKSLVPPANKLPPAPKKKRPVTDEGPITPSPDVTTADKGAE